MNENIVVPWAWAVVWSVRTGREDLKREKGIWWMPWHREAMKDVAPCEKLRGGGSDL